MMENSIQNGRAMDTGACLGCLEELESRREGLGMAGIPGGNGESLPILPVCISFWNSYPVLSNIPQKNNERGKKNQNKNQPTLPKETKKKKNSQTVSLWSLWERREGPTPLDEKEPRWFLSISNCKVLKLPTLPKSIPNRIQQKSGRLPQRFPPPSQVLRRQPIPKEKKNQNQTILNRNREFALISRRRRRRHRRIFGNIGMCCLPSRLEEGQGKGAAMNSAH